MKYSVILGNLGSCSDRYMIDGYSKGYNIEKLFERLDQMEGIDGVELIGGWNVTPENMPLIKEKTANIPVVAIIPDHFGKALWGKGAFTSPDKITRQKAIEETNNMAQYARELGCKTISIWNGQDGYDYPMQAHYINAHNWLIEGIKECAAANPDIQFSLEYKPKEPRNHSFLPNVWNAITIAKETGLKNVGITVDVGHSFEAYENVSEAVCAAHSRGLLNHIHINDNYRLWDDDMITGSIHTIEYIELFYWLKRIGYNGYISIDQYPYREESLAAAQESINQMKAFEAAAARIDESRMQEILNNNDAVASVKYMRQIIFG